MEITQEEKERIDSHRNDGEWHDQIIKIPAGTLREGMRLGNTGWHETIIERHNVGKISVRIVSRSSIPRSTIWDIHPPEYPPDDPRLRNVTLFRRTTLVTIYAPHGYALGLPPKAIREQCRRCCPTKTSIHPRRRWPRRYEESTHSRPCAGDIL